MTRRWPKEKLAKVHHATADVAAYKVCVHAFELGGRENAPSQDTFAESRGEALDLVFQSFQHVHLGTVRNVAVRPRNVFPGRSAQGIEESGLSQENERAICGVPTPHGIFRRGNLLEIAS